MLLESANVFRRQERKTVMLHESHDLLLHENRSIRYHSHSAICSSRLSCIHKFFRWGCLVADKLTLSMNNWRAQWKMHVERLSGKSLSETTSSITLTFKKGVCVAFGHVKEEILSRKHVKIIPNANQNPRSPNLHETYSIKY